MNTSDVRALWIAVTFGLLLPASAMGEARPISVPPAAEAELERLRVLDQSGETGEFSKLAARLDRSFAARYGKDSSAYAELLMCRALSIFYGDPAASLPMFRESLRRYEAALGPKHVDVALALHTLADATDEAQGDPALPEIETLYRRVYAIRHEALGPENSETAAAALAIARVLMRRATVEKAPDHLNEADEKAAFAVRIYAAAPDRLSLGFREVVEAKLLHARIVVARGDLVRGGEFSGEAADWYRTLSLSDRSAMAEDFYRDYLEVLRGLGRGGEADKLDRLGVEADGDFAGALDKYFAIGASAPPAQAPDRI